MKKRSYSSSEYSDEGCDSFSSDFEDEEIIVYSDTEIDYKSDVIVVFPSKKTNPKKKAKTQIERKRERTIKQIKCLNTTKESMYNQVLDSNFTIQQKSNLITELEGFADKEKTISYIKRVLKIPHSETDNIKKNKNIILELRNNLENTVHGHQETKEEIIDFITSKITNPKNYKSQILALKGPPGIGKCHAKDTEILMYDGHYKAVQDIAIGDKIMGDDSSVRNVTNLGSGEDTLYEITHIVSKKRYIVNSEHILCLISIKDGNLLEIPVKEFILLPENIKLNYRGYSNSVEFPEKELDVDPVHSCDWFTEYTEFLPVYYKLNSRKIRIKILHSLCNLWGICERDTASIIIHNSRLADDIIWLIYSLGFVCTKLLINSVYYIKIHKDAYYIKNYEQYLHSKTITCQEEISIQEVGTGDYYGFTLDGNNKYLIKDFVVTHNTRFIRALGDTLQLPFNQISFGGLNDVSILTGHDYTYIGSKPGKIYDILVKSKTKNCIIYLDEIDKVSSPESDKFIAINGVLTHMLDPEQNSEFHDNYLGEFTLDLSKVFFIVSFNNTDNIDPVVLNRLKVIDIKESSLSEKVEIVKRFTLPETCKNIGLSIDSVSISDDIIRYIIYSKTKNDKGMRSINKNIATLMSKINTLLYIEKIPENAKLEITKGLSYEKIDINKYKLDDAVIVSKEFVDLILKHTDVQLHSNMYV